MFVNNIMIDRRQKNILRDYFGFKNIRTAKKNFSIQNWSNDRVWRYLDGLYTDYIRQQQLREIERRNQRRNQLQLIRQRLNIANRNALFRNFVERRRQRVDTQAQEGRVRNRFMPTEEIPFVLPNINRILNIVSANLVRKNQNQTLLVQIILRVRYENQDNFIDQRRTLLSREYTPQNRVQYFNNPYHNQSILI